VRHSEAEMMKETTGRTRSLLMGIAAGLLAGVVTGQTDRLGNRLVSERQKRREKRIREDSPHKVAGPHFARKLANYIAWTVTAESAHRLAARTPAVGT
jgi:hypothetical protein